MSRIKYLAHMRVTRNMRDPIDGGQITLSLLLVKGEE